MAEKGWSVLLVGTAGIESKIWSISWDGLYRVWSEDRPVFISESLAEADSLTSSDTDSDTNLDTGVRATLLWLNICSICNI